MPLLAGRAVLIHAHPAGLHKGRPALQGLNLEVCRGQIFGFLGRNGAGKTTTIKTLIGLLKADSGTASVFGIPVTDADRSVKIRRRIGFVTEDKELYPDMTVEQKASRKSLIRELSVEWRQLPYRRTESSPESWLTVLPLCRGQRKNHLVSETDARCLSASSSVLCRFFTKAEKISVDIFNIEVLATPWSLFEWSNDMGSLRLQFIE